MLLYRAHTHTHAQNEQEAASYYRKCIYSIERNAETCVVIETNESSVQNDTQGREIVQGHLVGNNLKYSRCLCTCDYEHVWLKEQSFLLSA